MRAIDLKGQRFSRLIVLEEGGSDSRGNKRWLCRCDCGKEFVTLGTRLRMGATKSCGCYAEALVQAAVTKAKQERRYFTKSSWTAMVGRCTNPKYPAYPRYGGAGIQICQRWLKGENGVSGWLCFYEDMGPRPEGTTLDRIDGAQGYYPGNCKWSTPVEQQANRKPPRPYRTKKRLAKA
jgi:hypothetical protein